MAVLTALVITLSGCSSLKQTVDVHAVQINKHALELPQPDVLVLEPITWSIITENNFESEMQGLKSSGAAQVYFAITDEMYKNLLSNNARVRKYIEQQQTIIDSYRDYYSTNSTNSANSANSTNVE
jgi:hypothetical protein